VRLVVTGREGQVVRSLVECAVNSPFQVVPLGRPELDLSGPEAEIITAIETAQPDVVVSAAGYTLVDKAEAEPDRAFAINEHGVRALAWAANGLAVPLIHLSTDYVFDGAKDAPYTEEDPPHPTGVYGASKLAGEQAAMADHQDCAILRTAWVYSPFGANFVKTMLRLAGSRDEVGVVADQRGNPTSALDIADAILAIARNLRTGADAQYRGVFHMTAAGDASWAELAQAVFSASAEAGGPTARVRSITTADYATAARRPANSRLDCGKLERAHGVRLPEWRASLPPIVSRLVAACTQSKVTHQ
jgi:dTDP-4-dehydrorhamnose reductase